MITHRYLWKGLKRPNAGSLCWPLTISTVTTLVRADDLMWSRWLTHKIAWFDWAMKPNMNRKFRIVIYGVVITDWLSLSEHNNTKYILIHDCFTWQNHNNEGRNYPHDWIDIDLRKENAILSVPEQNITGRLMTVLNSGDSVDHILRFIPRLLSFQWSWQGVPYEVVWPRIPVVEGSQTGDSTCLMKQGSKLGVGFW